MSLDIKRVGINIFKSRKGLNMTQMELADLLKISHQAVSKWERGECLPDIELLIQLSRIFNTKVDNLLLSDELSSSSSREDSTDTLEEIRSNPWNEVLQIIKNQISKPSFDTWFKNTAAEYDGKSITVFSPNQFSTQWLYSRYTSMITKALDTVTNESNLEIVFQSRDAYS